MKKFFLVLLIILIGSFITFYFWASSSFNEKASYNEVIDFPADPKLASDTFSILTYNVGYFSGMTNNLSVEREESLFSNNLARSVGLLKGYEFDFIGLQEVDFGASRSFDHNQFDSLGIRLGFAQGAKAVNWDKLYIPFPYLPVKNQFGKMYSGQGILSKMKFISNDLLVFDKPLSNPFYYNDFYIDRILQISKVQIGEDTLVVMNVHLEAFDKETRELQAEIVLNEFRKWSENYPVILMGDFNSRPPFASEVIEYEKTVEMFLKDSLISEAISKDRYLQNEKRYFTFDTADPYERLDYIFYNNTKIQKIDSDVLREANTISDHLPVWMTFTLVK